MRKSERRQKCIPVLLCRVEWSSRLGFVQWFGVNSRAPKWRSIRRQAFELSFSFQYCKLLAIERPADEPNRASHGGESGIRAAERRVKGQVRHQVQRGRPRGDGTGRGGSSPSERNTLQA